MENLFVSVGGCGNRIGCQYWDMICDEHGVGRDGTFNGEDRQLEGIDFSFHERMDGSYTPRAILFDLDQGMLDQVASGPLKGLFQPDAYVGSSLGGASGDYWQGVQALLDSNVHNEYVERRRKQIERCDTFGGIVYAWGAGGPTAAAMGNGNTNMIDPGHFNVAFEVMPSMSYARPRAAVNTILTNNNTRDFGLKFYVEFEGLRRVCQDALHLSRPTLGDLNHVACTALSHLTSGMRFRSEECITWKKMKQRLISQGSMGSQLSLSLGGITRRGAEQPGPIPLPDLFEQTLATSNQLLMGRAKQAEHRRATSHMIVRGEASAAAVKNFANLKFLPKHQAVFSTAYFSPKAMSTSVCDFPSKGTFTTACLVSQSDDLLSMMTEFSLAATTQMKNSRFKATMRYANQPEEFYDAMSQWNDSIGELRTALRDGADGESKEEEEGADEGYGDRQW